MNLFMFLICGLVSWSCWFVTYWRLLPKPHRMHRYYLQSPQNPSKIKTMSKNCGVFPSLAGRPIPVAETPWTGMMLASSDSERSFGNNQSLSILSFLCAKIADCYYKIFVGSTPDSSFWFGTGSGWAVSAARCPWSSECWNTAWATSGSWSIWTAKYQ